MHAFPVDLYPHLAGPEPVADPPDLRVGVVRVPNKKKASQVFRSKAAVEWPQRKERVDEWLQQEGGV